MASGALGKGLGYNAIDTLPTWKERHSEWGKQLPIPGGLGPTEKMPGS